ncbi:MAG: hypothetical protein HZB55_18145 [Deltaproteobacteria bacterium]|nr:hypothetical protein [Deltaproteobacteria bacterium]
MDITALATTFATPSAEPLPKDLEGACRAFEQQFSALVFRKMREAMVPKAAKGSSGFAQDTAQGLLEDQWARLASQGEGLGLWRALLRQVDSAGVKSPAPKAEEKGMIALRPRDRAAPPAAERGAPIVGRGLRAPVGSGRAGVEPIHEEGTESP